MLRVCVCVGGGGGHSLISKTLVKLRRKIQDLLGGELGRGALRLTFHSVLRSRSLYFLSVGAKSRLRLDLLDKKNLVLVISMKSIKENIKYYPQDFCY